MSVTKKTSLQLATMAGSFVGLKRVQILLFSPVFWCDNAALSSSRCCVCVCLWCHEANIDDSLWLSEQHYEFVRKNPLASSAKWNPSGIVVAAKMKLIESFSPPRVSSLPDNRKQKTSSSAGTSSSEDRAIKDNPHTTTRRFCFSLVSLMCVSG